jgi:hypothetical protein
VALFDGTAEHPPSKALRYLITTLVFIALIAGASWYLLRFHSELQTTRHFLDYVVAGKMEDAYKMTKPTPSYSLKDFLDDWGPEGYYGPVKSYHLEHAEERKQGPEPPSGVVITIELSPYDVFPASSDAAKQSKTKEVRLQIEYKDESVGFAP